MKAESLKPCACCGKGVMHAGTPIFYRLQVQTMGVDTNAVRRRHGLEQMLGGGQPGAVLASVMGPDEDIAIPVGEASDRLVCMPCMMDPNSSLALLIGDGS